MCEVADRIERTPRLLAALVEIRQTIKRLLRDLHTQTEEPHGAQAGARHA